MKSNLLVHELLRCGLFLTLIKKQKSKICYAMLSRVFAFLCHAVCCINALILLIACS